MAINVETEMALLLAALADLRSEIQARCQRQDRDNARLRQQVRRLELAMEKLHQKGKGP